MKRKLLAVTLAALLALAVVTPVMASDVTVFIDGAQVQFEGQGPVLVEDHTLVPVRDVFEQLEFSVVWENEAREVTLLNDAWTVTIEIGSNTFVTNGESFNLVVPAQLVNDRTVLPIRPILESVGFVVEWDGAANSVLIFTEAQEPVDEYVQYEPVEEYPVEEYPVEESPEEEYPEEEYPEEEYPVAEYPVEVEATLVGVWFWEGMEYYVLNADGTGTMAGMNINWELVNNVLFVCSTPDMCESLDNCPLPMEWYFVLEGNNLTLTSATVEGMVFYYTRG